MSTSGSPALFSCTTLIPSGASTITQKRCHKKYKTEKGLLKHYNMIHKDELRKMGSILNYNMYYEKYVKRLGLPSTQSKSDETPSQSQLPLIQQQSKPSSNTYVLQSTLETKIHLMEHQYKLLANQHKFMSMKFADFEKRLKSIECQTKKYCIVCWEHESNYALVPCGHKIVCGTCAVAVLSGKRECPVCSQAVYDLIQIWDGGRDESEE